MARTRQPDPECLLTRATATVLAPDFVDDFDWAYVSPDGLSVQRAFAIATQWAQQLLRHVGCAMHENSKGLRVLPNLEWIEVSLGCCAEEQSLTIAVAARASVTVWQAIAACRGFELQENGTFWRRVFDEINRVSLNEGGCSGADCSSIKTMTEEVQLFDGVPFPRLKLELWSNLDANTVDRIASVFIGEERDDSELTHRIQDELTAVLNELCPVVSFPETGLAEVQVSLGVDDSVDEISRLQQLIATIESRHTVAADEGQGSVERLLLTQRWKVVCIHRDSTNYDNSTATTDGTYALRHMIPIQRSHQHVRGLRGRQELGRRLRFMRYVRWALGACDDDEGYIGGGVQRLSFSFYNRPEGMAAICSALPYTTSLIGFDVHGTYPSDNDFDDNELAWLAYALFHPDTASSTWRELEMHNLFYESVSFDAGLLVKMMARGNNLHVLLRLGTVQTDRYFAATIQEGAALYATASQAPSIQATSEQEHTAQVEVEATGVGGDPEIVLVLDKATTMDVCVVTTDIAVLDAWVPVIVPGFGIAYVASSFVHDITARAPGRPFLERMRVSEFDCVNADSESLLIRLCGGEVEYLDYTPYRTPPSLQPIYDACPKLKSFRLGASHNALRELKLPPGLRELEVAYFKPAQLIDGLEATFLQMTNLETLSLKMQHTPAIEDINNLVLPLLRGLKSLRRFFWIAGCDLGSDLESATYTQRRSIARHMIPGLVRGKDDVAVLSDRSTEAIVALLSVVRHATAEGWSVVGQLGQDQVSLIGEFAGTAQPRELWIEGGKRWIYAPTGSALGGRAQVASGWADEFDY